MPLEKVLQLMAPAKINLSLEIMFKRKDGFHELRTVMQELAYGDLLYIRELPEGRLEFYCNDPSLPEGLENLAWQAAALLQTRYAPERGAHLSLFKKIPVAAGLGGGSSDAAAVLRGLNKLWGLKLELETLQELAAGLGSDVPFFMRGGTALAEGRGERITPLPPLPPLPVLLVFLPDFSLSTPAVYRALNWNKTNQGERTGRFARFLNKKSISNWNYNVLLGQLEKYLVNDLETGAFNIASNLSTFKDELQQPGLHVLMSGSGPAFFILFSEPDRLVGLGDELTARGYKVILTEFAASTQESGARNQHKRISRRV